MSFEKSLDLLRLADMAAARHGGVSLRDITEEFGCNQRTAQRMIRALETTFDHVSYRVDSDMRRWWTLRDRNKLGMPRLRDVELVALEMAIRRAQREQADPEMRALVQLRDRLLASIPRPHARRAESDAEAYLEANGFASRPGPRVRLDPVVLGAIHEALKAPFSLEITYQGARDAHERTRLVEPYGLILGLRRYLIAKEVNNSGSFRRFRVDRIRQAQITGQSFARDAEFDLDRFSARAFGSFHADAEYGPVIWRFSPQVADVARDFQFHPDQVVTEEQDGGLRVEFSASGWIEMAWHLYQWGDQVEVIAPLELRKLVADYRRSDIAVVP